MNMKRDLTNELTCLALANFFSYEANKAESYNSKEVILTVDEARDISNFVREVYCSLNFKRNRLDD